MRRSRNAGFTLVELVAYLALITAGSLVIAGIELTASRAAYLERALVDLALAGETVADGFRGDVQTATASKLGSGNVLVVLGAPQGGEIQWLVENARVEATPTGLKAEPSGKQLQLVRVVASPGTTPVRGDPIGRIEKLEVVREAANGRSRWRLDLTFAYARGDQISVRKSYHVSAVQLAEDDK